MSYRLGFREHDGVEAGTTAIDRRRAFTRLIGESEGLKRAVEAAAKLSGHRISSLLLRGEPGTGKELLARTLHAAGTRAGEPFMHIDCANVPEAQLESDLFGHEPGAVPEAAVLKRGMLELTAGGTLLLEHIERLPAALQPKLLGVLEGRRAYRVGGTAEFRVGCAIVVTCGDTLGRAVEEALFREDLYERLNREVIVLPPLRERGRDVALLAEHFVQEMARDEGMFPVPLSDALVDVLAAHAWPGNVRELRAAVRGAFARATGSQLELHDLTLHQRRPVQADQVLRGQVGAISIPSDGLSLKQIEAQAIRLTLDLAEDNRTAAAKILGISRPTLIRKIRDYDLQTLPVTGGAR